jgi:hypothetical protein
METNKEKAFIFMTKDQLITMEPGKKTWSMVQDPIAVIYSFMKVNGKVISGMGTGTILTS